MMEPLLHRVDPDDNHKLRRTLPGLESLIAFLVPALTGFLFGYDIGAASTATRSLNLEGSPFLDGYLRSASLCGATLGSALTLICASPLGRRRTIIAGAFCYLVGTLISCTTLRRAMQVPTCIIGRIVYGLGIGLSMHSAPAYIAESATASTRGCFVSMKEAMIVLGMVTGFGFAAIFAGATDAWRRIWWSIPLPISLCVIIGMLRLPPSPRWIVDRANRRGDLTSVNDDARAALVFFRKGASDDAIEDELADIAAELRTERVLRKDASMSVKAAVAGFGLVTLQQITGQPSVLYYATDIFWGVGFVEIAPVASLIVGISKLIATLASASLVDKIGRRPLLLVGIGMMAGSLLVLVFSFVGVATCGESLHFTKLSGNLTLFALMMYVCGYQIGFGPITWLTLAEGFPLQYRACALSTGTLLNFSLNLIVTFTFQPWTCWFEHLAPGRGQSNVFFVYFLLCVFSLWFVYMFVAEARGKRLERIT